MRKILSLEAETKSIKTQVEKAKANFELHRQQKTLGPHTEPQGACEESGLVSGGTLAEEEIPVASNGEENVRTTLDSGGGESIYDPPDKRSWEETDQC